MWSSPLFVASGCFFGTNKFKKICIYTGNSNLLEGHWHEVMKVLFRHCAWSRAAGSAWNPAATKRSLGVLGVHLQRQGWDQSPLPESKTLTEGVTEGVFFFWPCELVKSQEREGTGELAFSLGPWIWNWFYFSLPFRWAVFYVYFLSECLCTTWIALQVYWSCKVSN